MFKADHSFLPCSSFILQVSNVLCRRGAIRSNKNTFKWPCFMLCILKQSLKSVYPLKLLSGTKQQSRANVISPLISVGPWRSRPQLRISDTHVHACVYLKGKRFIHACMRACVWIQESKKRRKRQEVVSAGWVWDGTEEVPCHRVGFPLFTLPFPVPARKHKILGDSPGRKHETALLYDSPWPLAKPPSHDSFSEASRKCNVLKIQKCMMTLYLCLFLCTAHILARTL